MTETPQQILLRDLDRANGNVEKLLEENECLRRERDELLAFTKRVWLNPDAPAEIHDDAAYVLVSLAWRIGAVRRRGETTLKTPRIPG